MVNSNAGGDKGSLDKISIVRYFQSLLISGTAASGGTVKLSYGSDDGVQTPANLVVAQSTTANGTYSSLGMSLYDASSVTSATYNPASGDFILLGSTGGNSLPVQLASFVGSFINQNNVQLEWTTISEINNYGFYVERRAASEEQFTTVSDLIAGAGYTLEPQYYMWTDESATESEITYRLKQVDNDGLINYYGPITVTMNPTGVKDEVVPAVFKLEQNYPNPFNPSTIINYQLPISSYTILKVYNIIGKEVATLVNGYKTAGSHQVTFSAEGGSASGGDGSQLSSGIYLYKLQSGNSVEVRKLTLVK